MDANITACFYGIIFLASMAVKNRYPDKPKPLTYNNPREK